MTKVHLNTIFCHLRTLVEKYEDEDDFPTPFITCKNILNILEHPWTFCNLE